MLYFYFEPHVCVCVCLYSSTVKASSVCVMPSSIIAVSENVIFHPQRRAACHPYVTPMPSVCHSYVLVCTRMSSVCHSYYSMSSVSHSYVPVCHSYVLVCYPYVTRMYSYVIRISLVCGFTMNRISVLNL